MIIGKHLIAGKWLDSTSQFTSNFLNGETHEFFNGSSSIVNKATAAAQEAFISFAQTDSTERAKFLREISKELQKQNEIIIETASQESGLPIARLTGELGRTTGQLEMFANHIENGAYLDRQHDEALPRREPMPRPSLKRMMRPFGPVVIFGASNFPLAFSTAGGDTASALAAGCPVIVKAHPAHPATSDLVAQSILAAITTCKLNSGIFSLIQDSGYEVAQQLVTDPIITAVGFTGSIKGGRALYDLCVSRPTPIPFYGEMGSINPLFVLPNALESSAEEIATGWAASLTMGVGQFCTKPGLMILPKGEVGDNLVEACITELKEVSQGTMLTESIADIFNQGAEKIQEHANVQNLLKSECGNRSSSPHIVTTSAESWLNTPELHEEIFGPFGIIVRTESPEQMLDIAKSLEGQLTATLHIREADYLFAKKLVDILEHKAGRILANGYPTGVEVADTMVHGGPYPASTFMATTSVGSLAINRFLKPVCYQNLPDELLPKEIRD